MVVCMYSEGVEFREATWIDKDNFNDFELTPLPLFASNISDIDT